MNWSIDEGLPTIFVYILTYGELALVAISSLDRLNRKKYSLNHCIFIEVKFLNYSWKNNA